MFIGIGLLHLRRALSIGRSTVTLSPVLTPREMNEQNKHRISVELPEQNEHKWAQMGSNGH